MKLLNKKGVAVWQLAQISLMLVLVGVTFGIGVYINEELYTTSYGTTAVVNESVTFTANNTYYDLLYKAASITEVANDSFTFGPTDGHYATRDYEYITQIAIYTNASGGPLAATAYNVSYNSYQSDAHFATMNATKSVRTFAQWLPIIAIMIAASVVIAVLGVWFMGR